MYVNLSLENAKECLNNMQKEFDARDPKMKNEYYHVSVMKDDIDVENEMNMRIHQMKAMTKLILLILQNQEKVIIEKI